MTYKQSILKRHIEFLLIWPIVFIGKIYGKLKKPNKQYSHFLFFPAADIGGSIKVNAEITECIKDKHPLIIFSKKPKNNKFLPLFNIEGVDILDLHNKIDNKAYHFVNIFYRGVLASWINSSPDAVIFGGESLYFYKIVPHVKNTVKKVELCHLNTWFNYSQAFIKDITIRIFSTPKIKRDAEQLYRQNNLPKEYFDRLFFVDNKVEIPVYKRVENNILQILFVGRNAPQKRIYLLAKIADTAYSKKLPVHFTLVGDVASFFVSTNPAIYTILGEVGDRKELENIYERSDMLILTSAYEGLPLVVMDMMARGKIILSTDVDGIPDYITHKETGMLITEKEDDKIVAQAIELIELLLNDPELRKAIELRTYRFAVEHFGESNFNNFYRRVLS